MGQLAVYVLAATLAVGAVGAGVYALAFDDDDRAPIEEIQGRPDEADELPEPELQPVPTDGDGDDGDTNADDGTAGGEDTVQATGGGGDTNEDGGGGDDGDGTAGGDT